MKKIFDLFLKLYVFILPKAKKKAACDFLCIFQEFLTLEMSRCTNIIYSASSTDIEIDNAIVAYEKMYNAKKIIVSVKRHFE